MNHNLSVENESYRKMINESKNSVLEYSRKVSIYEGNLGTLTKENDELKRRTLEIN